MSKEGSYHQALRSSSIIGGASVVNIIVGLLRLKVAAVLLGPAGVGLIGLLTNLAGTAAAVAGLGIGNVGTRQIAEAVGYKNVASLAATRRALFWGSLALAILGSAVFWALRDALAVRVLGDTTLSGDVGWLALVVGLTVAASSQTALLTGLRRIGDLARVSVLSALLSAVLSVGALMMFGRGGLTAFVIAAPLASFLVGYLYVTRLPKIEIERTPFPVLAAQWRILAKLGAAFMIAGLAGTVGQLLVRVLIQRQLGDDAVGYFQAAATISLTYIGLVLVAMGADYYPRLTAAIHDHRLVNRMVNEQTEVGLLLAGPFFLAMIGLAPWLIALLYSTSFHPAADVLRWMALGDVLKVASWPLGFILLAAGDGRTFMLTESLAAGVYVLLTLIGLAMIGIVATGVAFVGVYVVLLPIVYWLARQKTGFRWTTTVWRLFRLLLLAAMTVLAAAEWTALAGAIVGLVMSTGCGVFSFIQLAHKTNLTGPLGQLASNSRQLLMKLGAWRD